MNTDIFEAMERWVEARRPHLAATDLAVLDYEDGRELLEEHREPGRERGGCPADRDGTGYCRLAIVRPDRVL
jgi:hypothetical protein